MVCLFCICFGVCNAKNIVKYLITVKIVFYIMKFIKKLRIVIMKQFLYVFLTMFYKMLFVFVFQKRF